MVLVVAAACSGSDASEASGTSPGSTTTTVSSPGEELCASLSADGYEARKKALAEAADAAGEAPCRDLVGELEAAMAIEERAAGFEHSALAVELSCFDTHMQAALISSAPEPAGFAGALSRHPAGEPGDPGRVGTELVEWRIEPGERLETERGLRPAEVDSCGAGAQVFLADDSPHDASIPGDVADDDQSSEDPRVWFPALIAAEDDWKAQGDPDGVALTEDIRSLGYRELVAGAPGGPSEGFERPREFTVCRALRGPDERWTALVYKVDRGAYSYTNDAGELVELPAETSTDLGVFRRGADGRWRWLIRSILIEPHPCTPVL